MLLCFRRSFGDASFDHDEKSEVTNTREEGLVKKLVPMQSTNGEEEITVLEIRKKR